MFNIYRERKNDERRVNSSAMRIHVHQENLNQRYKLIAQNINLRSDMDISNI